MWLDDATPQLLERHHAVFHHVFWRLDTNIGQLLLQNEAGLYTKAGID